MRDIFKKSYINIIETYIKKLKKLNNQFPMTQCYNSKNSKPIKAFE